MAVEGLGCLRSARVGTLGILRRSSAVTACNDRWSVALEPEEQSRTNMLQRGCSENRKLIEAKVNVTASRKKESFRNVRVITRSGPVRPGNSYNVY